ncbi:MAG: DNA topoisomerase IV subunit A, partial [Limosilactobacillus fermentum]
DDQLVGISLASDGDHLGLVTQRGAFKEMAVGDLEVGARARRGNLVLHRLKKNPHQVVALVTHPADFTGALEIITNRPAFQDVLVAEQRLGTAQSNGSFVVDTDTQGVPVTLREKLIAKVSEGEEIELL